jgi:hypothetical protein
VLGFEPQVLKATPVDDLLLDVVGLGSPGRGHFIPRRTGQFAPAVPGQRLGLELEVLVGIEAKQERDLARRVLVERVPAVQVGGLAEVGVAAHPHRLKPRPQRQLDGLVQIPRGILMAGPVARAVQQVQRLLGVGQRDQQRVITPDAVVADVHARLAAPLRRGQRAIGIEDRRVEELRGLVLPHLQPRQVDRVLQVVHLIGRLEAAAKVPGRGGVGNAAGPQGVQVRLVVAQQLQILQAAAPAHHVVGDVQHVVRLVVRQMDLEQVNPPVDQADQVDLAGQQVNGPDAAAADGPRAVGHVVVDVAGRQHRLGSCVKSAGPEPALDSALASKKLLACSKAHSKRLLAIAGQRVCTTL